LDGVKLQSAIVYSKRPLSTGRNECQETPTRKHLAEVCKYLRVYDLTKCLWQENLSRGLEARVGGF
jgi:hypothetical protein